MLTIRTGDLMRIRIVAMAATLLLAASMPSPAVAVHVGSPTDAAVSFQTQLGGVTAIDLHTTKKSTKKTTKKSSEKASIWSIGDATPGKASLEIKGKVAKGGRTCDLDVKWKDGQTSSATSTARNDKICEMHVAVPSSSGVKGTATANLTVRDDGNKVASASATF